MHCSMSMRSFRLIALAVPLLAASSALADAPASTAAPAASAPPAAPVDPELARLRAAQGHALRWNWVPPGQTARYGHGEAIVQAPIDVVRAQVLDFPRWKDYSGGKFKTSRIVDKDQGGPGTTDLYIQVPIMHGMIMLWQTLRFQPLKTTAPGTELLAGKLVNGNVNAADVQISMRAVDPQTTVLKCDLLITPQFAAPQSAIDHELRDAAADAVDAILVRSQTKVAAALVAAAAGGPVPATSASAAPAPVADGK